MLYCECCENFHKVQERKLTQTTNQIKCFWTRPVVNSRWSHSIPLLVFSEWLKFSRDVIIAVCKLELENESLSLYFVVFFCLGIKDDCKVKSVIAFTIRESVSSFKHWCRQILLCSPCTGRVWQAVFFAYNWQISMRARGISRQRNALCAHA